MCSVVQHPKIYHAIAVLAGMFAAPFVWDTSSLPTSLYILLIFNGGVVGFALMAVYWLFRNQKG